MYKININWDCLSSLFGRKVRSRQELKKIKRKPASADGVRLWISNPKERVQFLPAVPNRIKDYYGF